MRPGFAASDVETLYVVANSFERDGYRRTAFLLRDAAKKIVNLRAVLRESKGVRN